ncbi:MAG: acetate--CoA ligase family protein [Halobacteriales archaeon]|nr:acetate--CoA ligase family protein [Halobacteriales archaeon]
MRDLSELFSPDRVAVVGASSEEGSVGRAIMTNLLADFSGDVVPVNPNHKTVCGEPCVDGIDDTEGVDLAVIVVPPSVVLDVLRAGAATGIKNYVVITAGFGEAGSEGANRERELRELATEHELNIVGPNSLGVLSTPTGLNATFGPDNATPGPLSFMSQSGAFVTAVLNWANDHGLGFKDIVSLGNKAVIDETDLLATWGDDPDTDVIIGYLESIQNGRAFIETAQAVTAETPAVVVKSGRTDAGAQAASSHTGAIAGATAAYEAGFDQAGIIRAETVQELFDAAQVLANQPVPETDGVAIVTNAGGPGVMATDAIGDSRLSLASFTDETLEQLEANLPTEANVYNPVDIIGDADIDRFATTIETVFEDPNVGAAIVLSAPTAVLSYDALAERIGTIQTEYSLPTVTCLMGGEVAREATATLREYGIPNYFDPARAVGSLETLAEYRAIREREYQDPRQFEVDRERASRLLTQAADRGDNRLGVEAMELLEAYGIPTPEGTIVDTPTDAKAAAAQLGEPVVMKIVSPDILHKSDIGGVKVGVDHDDVADAYEDLITRARNYQPDASILGVQIQESIDTETGIETIVGMNRDPQFGPLLMFGLGGIFVEILEDTSFRVAPVSRREASGMIDDIEAAPLLRGARGREPVAVEAVVETIERLSQLVTDFPAILELDINPLVARPDGVTAIDLRLTVDPAELQTEGSE